MKLAKGENYFRDNALAINVCKMNHRITISHVDDLTEIEHHHGFIEIVVCSSVNVPQNKKWLSCWKYFDVNLIKFIENFPDETSCRLHFTGIREQQGIICKSCGSKEHYWLQGKWQWKCSKCRFRTTLRSGSMMEHAKLPFRKWYIAMAFMGFSKKGLSATELQRQLGHKRYEPIWFMMHKIRKAKGNLDALYKLTNMVEFDEGCFETEIDNESQTSLKR